MLKPRIWQLIFAIGADIVILFIFNHMEIKFLNYMAITVPLTLLSILSLANGAIARANSKVGKKLEKRR